MHLAGSIMAGSAAKWKRRHVSGGGEDSSIMNFDPGHGWCGTPGGWCFSLLRWQCPGRYSGKCWSVSAGSIQHQAREYP